MIAAWLLLAVDIVAVVFVFCFATWGMRWLSH